MHWLVAIRKYSHTVSEERYFMEWIFALFARVALFIVWVSTPLVSHAFHEQWLLPLLGLLIVPLTTLVYVVVFALAGEVSGWNWFWVALALLLDLSAQGSPARRAIYTRNRGDDLPQEVK
jgi:hypothetical protein